MESATNEVTLLHHAAAASSHRGVIGWIPAAASSKQQQDGEENDRTTSTLVYASHAVLNLARPCRVRLAVGDDNVVEEPIWNVQETLCTKTSGRAGQDHVITCLSVAADANVVALVTGFADGTVTAWIQQTQKTSSWNELVVVAESTAPTGLAITCIEALMLQSTLLILVGTSSGTTLYECAIKSESSAISEELNQCSTTPLLDDIAVCSLSLHHHASSRQIWALVGTAAPRNNKIHVLHADSSDPSAPFKFHYCGSLLGHEDWITCLSWSHGGNNNPDLPLLLATGSQDARIRLWKFTTTTSAETFAESTPQPQDNDGRLSDDEDEAMEEDEEEGESRLDIYHSNTLTRVTLEALLMGHEEGVTSVSWYKQAKAVYNQDHLLLSSSMDRSILLWTAGMDGIWTPLTRLGSAGGILGGSVGSTLLGYLAASIEPTHGRALIGHAYGGALHVWNLDDDSRPAAVAEPLSTEDLASFVSWKATPCVTGHFGPVADLCWEASAGRYLLTASEDQTCRLWAPAPLATDSQLGRRSAWLEVARPQVHGYDMTAVTSLSSPDTPHFLVTGADEKELRGFEAPQMTIRTLEAVTGERWPAAEDDANKQQRVERAYIPSLGLSNKATAAEGAEEDAPEGAATATTRLPLERDLGAVSLWPEVQKLFGHKTELYCITSTLEAQSAGPKQPAEHGDTVLIASACKARDAEAAAIRLWGVNGVCHQVLTTGGHKSTVATLAFSPDGRYLASSGKDRRLCLWHRSGATEFGLAWAKDSAHKRIVWSVHFLPWWEKEGGILASGSRDGCVKIWSFFATENAEAPPRVEQRFSFAPIHKVQDKADAVTAVSFCPHRGVNKEDKALLALGLESGRIELWTIPLGAGSEQPVSNFVFPSNSCHKAAVTKLAWRPIAEGSDEGIPILASCSKDHGCRLFEVKV